jgi:UDPglucose 6-dehydrogenase
MALIEVVGVGFVGLTTAVMAAEAGHDVVGIESDAHRLKSLQVGILPFAEPGLEGAMRAQLEEGRLRFVDPEHTADTAAVLVVATPTPTTPSGDSDTSSVRAALRMHWNTDRHTLVMLRSTLLPGTIETILSDAEFLDLTDHLVHWPEFLNQGRALQDGRTPDRVVIGALSESAARLAQDLIQSMRIEATRYELLSIREAEAVKHFSNAALAVNQVLGAEIARLCEDMEIDANIVLQAISEDKRLDPGLLRPRAPLVDSCLRKDLAALIENLSLGSEPNILSATIRRASLLHEDGVQRVSRHVKAAGDSARVLIIGAGFTPAVSDTNGSLVWELLPELEGRNMGSLYGRINRGSLWICATAQRPCRPGP